MQKGVFFILAAVIAFSFLFMGCGPKKAGSSDDAITLAKAMETAEEKADYLITQAKAFYNSKEFQQSIDIAQYILQYVDKNSQDAKNLLEKAKEALKQKAQEAVTDVKSKIGSFGQ